MTLGVTYDATREQLQALVEKITAYLKSDPDILDEGITVAFSNMGASSLTSASYATVGTPATPNT